MRNLYVTAKDGHDSLAPHEIAVRVKPLFDNVIVDAESAAEMCRRDVERYGDYFKQKGLSTSVIEDQWKGAVVVEGWNDDAETERFRATLRNGDSFMLHFFGEQPWPVRRRIAKRIAEAIGYDFGLGEEV